MPDRRNLDPADILNVTAYRFVTLDRLTERRTRYLQQARALGLRGTIVLAEEGINFSLAGVPAAVATFLAELQRDPPFATLVPPLAIKRSFSAAPPFAHMLVKLKREIVALKRPDIRPDRTPAPRVSPTELKNWLDQGHDVVLLDTRNQFEIEHGTFVGAESLALRSFNDLPARLQAASRDWNTRTVVTFCTGGIRCEKAAPLLIEAGFQDVRQLDGGILRYFEECGTQHFAGDCFVFDARVALASDLGPADPREPVKNDR